MKEKIKNTKGITLIALVITVIILLILAMVSINLVLKDGIIKRAQNGVNAYNDAQINELQQLNAVESKMSQYGKETNNSEWFELTEEEIKQLVASEGKIAEVHGETEITVFLLDWRAIEEVKFPLISVIIDNNNDRFGAFVFAIEDCDCNLKNDFGRWEYSFKKNQWYVNTTNGSYFTSETMKEYNGKSPITMSDFEGGQIYCESILQKIIDALNK